MQGGKWYCKAEARKKRYAIMKVQSGFVTRYKVGEQDSNVYLKQQTQLLHSCVLVQAECTVPWTEICTVSSDF